MATALLMFPIFFAIIENWGDCGDGTYRPVGDADGSCCVDISDLLQIIGVWNSECVITGACCLPDFLA